MPRDVNLRIHFFHVKEQVMQKTKALGTQPNLYGRLQLFADLFNYTLNRRWQLNTVTKALRIRKPPDPISMDCSSENIYQPQRLQTHSGFTSRRPWSPAKLEYHPRSIQHLAYGPKLSRGSTNPTTASVF